MNLLISLLLDILFFDRFKLILYYYIAVKKPYNKGYLYNLMALFDRSNIVRELT